MPRDEIIADAFSALDGSRRKASVAQIGGFRPPETSLTSWFGGHFVGAPNETWPFNDGEPMLPRLQARTEELPYVPEQLKGVALFNVFRGPRKLPVGHAPGLLLTAVRPPKNRTLQWTGAASSAW